METREIKQLLQRYFEGETTVAEEQLINTYFKSEKVAEELKEYTGFFNGKSELTKAAYEDTIEDEIMQLITANEPGTKSNRIWLWQAVTGIAASAILVLGGYLFYQQQEQPAYDTFENPDVAYAYAEQTLAYVSAKYNKGIAALSNFDKLQTAAEPLQQGIQPLSEYFDLIDSMNDVDDVN